MDRNGIQTAMTSISSPGVYIGEADFVRGLARRCNETAAQLITDHAKRFRVYTTLPLLHTGAALKEIEYALDTLNSI